MLCLNDRFNTSLVKNNTQPYIRNEHCMYNIIVEKNIETLFRADSRSPDEIKKAGGFSMSGSINNAGTLGRYENGRAIEPIVYTAETLRGMRCFADDMPGEKYFYQINSHGLSVARYEKNFETPTARRNLTHHLQKQSALMEKVIGSHWKSLTEPALMRLLFLGVDGEKSWYDLTTGAQECHIIGSESQLHSPNLFYTYEPLSIIVSLDRIIFIGTKSRGKNSLPVKLG